MSSSGSPAAAFLAAQPELADRSRVRPAWTPEYGPFPALYLSHGAPPLFEDAEWIEALAHWADALPRPRGIVIVSAHWESAPIALSAPGDAVPLVYDFGGFDPFYYSMTYPPPDSSWLSDRVRAALPDSEPVVTSSRRGLDHGAWVPLKVMYPSADIPVLQMSLPSHDPHRLMAIGQRLHQLRDEGVAIIGSGFWTHGLPFLTADSIALGAVPTWSADFDLWAAEQLATGDIDALSDYASKAPGMPYAHPTVEHFSPLFVTLGAATDLDGGVTTTIDGFMWGLSRRSLSIR
jgi:4,5-DOPA dioxygenase extradiol